MQAHEVLIGSLTVVAGIASAPYLAAKQVSKKSKETSSHIGQALRDRAAKVSYNRNPYLPH